MYFYELYESETPSLACSFLLPKIARGERK